VSEPLDALTATREGTFQRDVVLLVEHDVFDAHAEGLEDQLVKLARNGRPQTFRHKGQCAVCLVVGGPGAVDALPTARLRQGMGWYVLVTAFDTATNRAADMPPKVRTGDVLSTAVLTAIQEAVTSMALAAEGDSKSELKTCPDCAEQVRVAARKCRFCGYQFGEPPPLRRTITREVDAQKEPAAGEALPVPATPRVAQERVEEGRPVDVQETPAVLVDTSEFKVIAGVVLAIATVCAVVISLGSHSRESTAALISSSATEGSGPKTPNRSPPLVAAERRADHTATWTKEQKGLALHGCRVRENELDLPPSDDCACMIDSLIMTSNQRTSSRP
jgi:hypothetical protein